MRQRMYRSIPYQVAQGEECGIKGRDAKAWYWLTPDAPSETDGPYKSSEDAEMAAEAWLRGEE